MLREALHLYQMRRILSEYKLSSLYDYFRETSLSNETYQSNESINEINLNKYSSLTDTSQLRELLLWS